MLSEEFFKEIETKINNNRKWKFPKVKLNQREKELINFGYKTALKQLNDEVVRRYQ